MHLLVMLSVLLLPNGKSQFEQMGAGHNDCCFAAIAYGSKAMQPNSRSGK